MPSRRTWLRLSVCLLLLILALGALTWLSVNRLLNQQQIEQVEWQGLRVSSDGLHLRQLAFQHPAAHVDIQALHIGWPFFRLSAPWLGRVNLQHLHVNVLESESNISDEVPTSLDVPQVAALIALLPTQLQVDQLDVELPCAEQHCRLSGALQAKNTSFYKPELNLDLSAKLTLHHGQDQLAWQARLLGQRQAPHIQLDLAINQQPQLMLQSSLEPKPAGQFWHLLVNADIQQAAALHSWLRQWLPASAQWGSHAPQTAQIEVKSNLLLPAGPVHFESLKQATGAITAYANLPQPWPIPAIGQIQGQVDLAAKSINGQWLADTLNSNLTLSQISEELSQALPAGLRPDAVQVKIQPSEKPAQIAEGLNGRALPVTAQIMVQGKAPMVLDSTLILSNNLPWAIQFVDAQLNMRNASLSVAELDLKALSANLNLNGYVDQQQFSFQLGKGSTLSSKQLAYGQWRAEQTEAKTQGLTVQGKIANNAPLDWHLQGTLDLAAKPLHEQLKPQRWYWQGPLTLNTDAFQLNGTLRNDAQLSVNLTLQHDRDKGLNVKAQFAEMFLRTGNPLQASFSAWPALLDLNNGRLKGNANIKLTPNQTLPNITADLNAKGLGGIYDRTELSGLSGNPKLQINGQALQLELPDITLEQANPGVPIGPIKLSGQYQAPLQALAKGTLKVTQAHSALIGGQLSLPANQWSLSDNTLLFPFELKGLELEQLFVLYPTEGLAGNGSIDGRLPLQLSAEGFSISNGQLEAKKPGGQLKFDSERIRQLGRSNPAMQLVTQSLEDFQFTTLSSQVNYDPQGKLALGIRLEGQNPAIEKGRPIHFNINLQEDIPTLMASLQLSDKVSEIIKQRVQKRMLEREANQKP